MSYGLFIELLRVSLGLQAELSVEPSLEEWKSLYSIAMKHTLMGVVFSGIERLPQLQRPPQSVLSKWIATVIHTEQANRHLNAKIKELAEICSNNGLESCLLKGQGVARLYPNPLRRQCGDVDLWIRGKRNATIDAFRNISSLTEICNHHAHCDIFPDAVVEIHFLPCWMYSPVTNKRLQRFFHDSEERQFNNFNVDLGVNVTDISFDLVFSAVHIYRHLFTEGIGLRQLLDYYYILSHSTAQQREEAYHVLTSLRMGGFASAMMHVLGKMFSMNKEFMYVLPDETVGEFLLSEILQAGNFGKYDSRITWRKKGLLSAFVYKIGRNLRFLRYFPSEVLWSPFWKVWHFIWRKLR